MGQGTDLGQPPLGIVWRAWSVLLLAAGTAAARADGPPVAPPVFSPGQSAIERILNPIARRLRAPHVVDFPRQPRLSRSSVPLRQITLLGGDRILAEVLGWHDDVVELRWCSGQAFTIPRAAIDSVKVPAGEIEALYDPFEPDLLPRALPVLPGVVRPAIQSDWLESGHCYGGAHSLDFARAAAPLVYSFGDGPNVSRVQFWFRIESSAREAVEPPADLPVSGSTTIQVAFQFDGSDHPARWSLSIGPGSAAISLDGLGAESATTQSVPLGGGWHCLTAAFLADHAICAVDEALLAVVPRSPGRLRSIRLQAAGPAWIDDLQISQVRIGDQDSVRASTQDDCIALHNGDQWYGRVSQVASQRVVMTGAAGERQAAWHSVDQIALRQSDRPVASESVAGFWAAIELKSRIDRPGLPSDRITAAITRINGDSVLCLHPWFGRLALGISQIARIEPLFFGTRTTVDARRFHLGSSIRSDFDRPVPDGTEWVGEFDLPAPLPANREVWLSLDAVDLEPSGPETPPASPFLSDLREGRLLTVLSINDRPAGNLNHWGRFRATRARPERLRCRLPASLLQPGTNSIRLHQLPLKKDGIEFDNCELSNLCIDVIERSGD